MSGRKRRLYPRFVRVVAGPKFVGRVNVIVSVVCMGVSRRAESLSDSKDVSVDEDSAGAPRAEG